MVTLAHLIGHWVKEEEMGSAGADFNPGHNVAGWRLALAVVAAVAPEGAPTV